MATSLNCPNCAVELEQTAVHDLGDGIVQFIYVCPFAKKDYVDEHPEEHCKIWVELWVGPFEVSMK